MPVQGFSALLPGCPKSYWGSARARGTGARGALGEAMSRAHMHALGARLWGGDAWRGAVRGVQER